MKPKIETDWDEFTFACEVQGREYSVTVEVIKTVKEVPDEYHWPSREEVIIGATLQGWESIPEHLPHHETEIEKQIMNQIHDRYEN